MVKNDQRGITGLETAIVLIAFVMVASVFAYVVLSAGLFSSQKAKEAINKGLGQTAGSVSVRGNVIAKMENGYLKEVYIPIASVSGGDPSDFSDSSSNSTKVVVSYTDSNYQFSSVNWTLTKVSTVNDDNLLDENEIFMITVSLENLTSGNSTVRIGPYNRFMLEIKPPTGAVLAIERTVPGRISSIINLY